MPDSLDRFRALAGAAFEGGYPTDETAAILDDELYFQRAVQSYLWALPAVNMFAMSKGLGDVAGYGYNVMSVYEKRLKPNTVITTPNSDVIYCLGFADLSQTGPLVLEAPPGIQGLLDDFWHRPLTGPNIGGVQYLGDIGIPGPDKGRGAKYLIVPEGHDLDIATDDYFVYTTKTNNVFIFQRGFFTSVDDLSPGVAAVEGLVIRPLERAAEPMKFQHVSDAPANALFPHDVSFFEQLHEMIQGERIDAVDPYMHGMLAALGVAKGRDFSPTDRQRELLDLAAQTAWKMAKSIAGHYDREANALWWEDRHWVAHAKTELDDFMRTLLDEQWRDRATGHTDVNAKAHMFINAYSISTGMMSSIVGMGAKYGAAYKDSEGRYLRGENTYRIDLPANPPANILWSVTVYDAETAAGVDTAQQIYPSLNSMNDLLYNDDGSVTFHIGPQPPEDAQNWLRTVPGRGWFSLIRWYGPTQEFFDRKYKPGDFVKV
ncbi:MAG: DUF1254 domain-containing protein [Mycolicibacterium frederiksbergense]|uniref:DUF1254 domain-containing protein n=1 Tax=Mycobacterium adipatum TaxID=1682113 RepID=UPI0027F2E560|nr:DUF1254 domain-containing protein [Mycolicibacterium frederiksbergense]